MEIRVLGSVELVGPDGPVPLAAMPRRLLAALAIEAGETCSVDALIDALWGEQPPRDGAKALQLYVSRLRKALPPNTAIRTDTSGYALELDADALDAGRFERLLAEAQELNSDSNPALAASLLERALSLWRGSPFGELAYEDFARGEAERLRELRLLAQEEQSDAELRLGRHAAIVGRLHELADAHPLRERMQAQLMLALYRCGRQADALEAFAAYRSRVSDELGLEPGDELHALQLRILRHDPALMVTPGQSDQLPDLPVALTRLLGRERELGELRRLLVNARTRLLVLTGAGGSGKTRLAVEAARQAARSFANGVCLVELAAVRNAELVLGAIASALAVEAGASADLFEALVGTLRTRELLLVLDNAEHVQAAAPLFTKLLTRAPRVSVLVTSRVVLHVYGERVYPVEPLDEEAAVELFRERARDAGAHIQATADDDEAIRTICRRLDGLPLALELAAGRTSALTVGEVHERLEPRLPLLTGGPRDLPARQQTLRATLDWSYDLLDEDERRDLRRLSVFVGGFTADAAEAVCDTRPRRLETLVEHNLVEQRPTASGSRYSMLETIREFAAEQLERAHDAEAVARRHADWCRELAEASVSPPRHGIGGTIEPGLVRLEAEHGNLRSAIAWAISNDEDELGLRLGAPCAHFWHERAHFHESVAWLRWAEPRIPRARPPVRLEALKAAGFVEFLVLANTARADRYWAEAILVGEHLGEAEEVAWIENLRANAAWELGRPEESLDLWLKALDRVRAASYSYGEAVVLKRIGDVLRDLDRLDEGEQALLEASEIWRDLGDARALAMTTHSLGDLALDRGDPTVAFERYRRSMKEHPDGRSAAKHFSFCLAGIASVLAERGLDDDAATIWGAVCAAEEALGFQMLGAERRRYETRLTPLEATPAWARGKALSLEAAAASVPDFELLG